MNKEKQIEEMVKIMNECCNVYDEQGRHIRNKCYECEEWSDDNHCCCSYNTKEATALYNAGYHKASEVAELEAKLADVTANWQKIHNAYDADCIAHYNKGRSDVAKEIEKYLLNYHENRSKEYMSMHIKNKKQLQIATAYYQGLSNAVTFALNAIAELKKKYAESSNEITEGER